MSLEARVGGRGVRRGAEVRDSSPSHPISPASCSASLACQNSAGFTLIEIIIVLFLLVGVLTLVIPRIVIGEDLGATGRQFIGAVRSLQSMATTLQKPVKLYLDLDQSSFWAVVVEGKEEKPPPEAAWSTPRMLPESIRFTDVSVRSVTRRSGRIDLSLYPNGRIESGLFHMMDGGGNVLAIAIEPVTGAIRTSDARIEPLRKPPIPDRIKVLLQPMVGQGGSGAVPTSRF